jgi:hypothetical protein
VWRVALRSLAVTAVACASETPIPKDPATGLPDRRAAARVPGTVAALEWRETSEPADGFGAGDTTHATIGDLVAARLEVAAEEDAELIIGFWGRPPPRRRPSSEPATEQAFESSTMSIPGGGRTAAGASVERPRPRKVRAPQSRLAGNARPPRGEDQRHSDDALFGGSETRQALAGARPNRGAQGGLRAAAGCSLSSRVGRLDGWSSVTDACIGSRQNSAYRPLSRDPA